MKKLLLFPLAILSLNAVSQSLQLRDNSAPAGQTITPSTTIAMVTSPEQNTNMTFDVKNTSASTKTYSAKRYDVLLNSNATSTASAYFCFAGSCYGNTTFISPNNLVLTTGQSASQVSGDYQMLVADLDEAEVVGLSIVKYTFFNVNTASDSVQVTLKYNGTSPSVGIKENAKSDVKFKLYPNPSNTGMVVLKSDADVSKVEVINQLGSVILSKNISSVDGKINLDLSSSAAGVYYVKVLSGNKFYTEKLVISNN